MKRTEPTPLANILQEALADAPLRAPISSRSAVLTFYEITRNITKGEPHSPDDEVKNGTLFLRIKSFPLRSEIMMRRSAIIAEINRRLGAVVVNNIRFR